MAVAYPTAEKKNVINQTWNLNLMAPSQTPLYSRKATHVALLLYIFLLYLLAVDAHLLSYESRSRLPR